MKKLSVTFALLMAAAVPAGVQAQLVSASQEDFEGGTLQGWELFGNVSVIQSGQGHALGCSDSAVAGWGVSPGQDFDLSLRMRLGNDGSAAEILLRHTGDPPNEQFCLVRFFPGETEIARRVGSQETSLASVQQGIGLDTWTSIGIRVVGGAIDVTTNGRSLVSAQDAQPLPAGIIALRCVPGIGTAIDDLVVQPPTTSVIPINIPGPQMQDGQGQPASPAGNVQQ
jgi:hypothetical protein